MCLSFVLFILFAVVRLGCNGLTFAKEKKTQKRDNTNTHLVCVFRKEHRAARSFIRRRGHHHHHYHHGTKDEGRRTKDDDEWRERGGAVSLSRARSVSRVRTKHVRELRRTRSLDEMQSVSRGVFLFGEVSENVLAVS